MKLILILIEDLLIRDPSMSITAICTYLQWLDTLITLAVQTLTMEQAKDPRKEWGEECVLFEKEADMLQAFLDLIPRQ